MTQRSASRGANAPLAFASLFRSALDELAGDTWPSSRWAKDPVGFATLILGVELWGFQVAVLERLASGARHTAVAGGRKIGKDFVGAVAALWWFASFADGRVLVYGPTMKQIDEIMWRQIRYLWAGHGRCVECKRHNPDGPRPCPHSALMVGKIGMSAKTGLRAPDMRQIIGMTAVASGGVIGLSGRILAIEDEAAQMRDDIDEAIVGNMAAADCARLAISNPTRTIGFFADLFHRNRSLCGEGGLFQVSSETSPNIAERRLVHRDLASLEWIAERERVWGRGSPPWLWHVEGKFLAKGEGQLFGIDEITAAEMRWEDDMPAAGRLTIGVDVAGDGYEGDETAFAARRGVRCEELAAARGLTPDGILERGKSILATWRGGLDVGDLCPKFVIDRDGEIGERVYLLFVAWAANLPEGSIEIVGFRGSPRVLGVPGESYFRNRDLLFGGFKAWLVGDKRVDERGNASYSGGGAIPSDIQLQSELVMLRWVDAEASGRGRSVLMPKSEMREKLQGRSPDRCDALALSTWQEAPAWKTAAPSPPEAPTGRAANFYDSELGRGRGLDPYGGGSGFR